MNLWCVRTETVDVGIIIYHMGRWIDRQALIFLFCLLKSLLFSPSSATYCSNPFEKFIPGKYNLKANDAILYEKEDLFDELLANLLVPLQQTYVECRHTSTSTQSRERWWAVRCTRLLLPWNDDFYCGVQCPIHWGGAIFFIITNLQDL